MGENTNSNKFMGSSLLKPFVVYNKKSEMKYVYCGEMADTREETMKKSL